MTADRVSGLIRRAGPALGLLVLGASLVVGADLFGTREALFGSATPAPRAAAFSRVDSSPARKKTVLRSQPWWQNVERFEGEGAKLTPPFRISDDAIQGRLRWSCERGRFAVRIQGKQRPLIDSSCAAGQRSTDLPEKMTGRLQIDADGPWKASVEQQVDVPLIEPPLPALSAPGTTKVATGGFYRIDQTGKGHVAIYRLASGRYALRLRNFYVSPNVDLEIRLSPLQAPHTTRDYLSAPAKLAAPLDITAGSMNFMLPAGVDPRRYRSVVIWCPLITSAYAAATLRQ